MWVIIVLKILLKEQSFPISSSISRTDWDTKASQNDLQKYLEKTRKNRVPRKLFTTSFSTGRIVFMGISY